MKDEKQHSRVRFAKQAFFWTTFLLFGLRHSGLPRLKKQYLWVLYTLQVFSLAILLLFCVKPLVLFDGIDIVSDSLHGMQSHFVVVSGRRVHYLTAGPVGGPPVVLVHGLGGIAEDWTGLQGYLTHAGFRVYMPELIGYGRSEKPAAYTYSVRNEADIVAGFLGALGLKQVDLGGWSMGGWIVQLVASEHPERVRRLTLFDSGGL
jgi:predicted alpha/beta-fold hydrolase